MDALKALLTGRMAELAVARDFTVLREVARLAQEGPPTELASTEPELFAAWRLAVTKYHLKGWTHMTPERIDQVLEKYRGHPGLRPRDPLTGLLKTDDTPVVDKAPDSPWGVTK